MPNKPTYSDMSVTVEIWSEASANISGKIDIDNDLMDYEIPFATLPGGIVAIAKGTPFINVAFSGTYENEFVTHTTHTFGYRHENGKGTPYHTVVNDPIKENGTKISGNVSLFFGIKGEIGLRALAGLATLTASFSFGPKVNGDIHIMDSEVNNYYDLAKDDCVSSSLHGEFQIVGKAGVDALGLETKLGPWEGDLFKKSRFALPKFTKPEYVENGENSDAEAKICTTVSRNLIAPVEVGLAIYDSENERIDIQYSSSLYCNESDFDSNPIELDVSELELGKKYICYPMVKMGEGTTGEYRATPTLTFGQDINILTGDYVDVEKNTVEACGYISAEEIESLLQYEYGICYTEEGLTDEWDYIPSNNIDENGKFSVTLSDLNQGTDYLYCAYLQMEVDNFMYGEEKTIRTKQTDPQVVTGEYSNVTKTSAVVICRYYNIPEGAICGVEYSWDGGKQEIRSDNNQEVLSFELTGLELGTTYTYRAFMIVDNNYIYSETTMQLRTKDELNEEETVLSCPDENHPHWIDLGLPSGTQWRCCNEGASAPEDYGGYYTFGQVASAPTTDQIFELTHKCSYTWTTLNGVWGTKFTGANGGTIFLPASFEDDFWGWYGSYWSSSLTPIYTGYRLFIVENLCLGDDLDKYYRFSVRPVRLK